MYHWRNVAGICCRRRRRSLFLPPSLSSFSYLLRLLKKNSQNHSSSTITTTTLAPKLFSTAGFALVAVSGIALAKPRVEALPHGSTEKQVASAALVFFVTLMLRGCLSLVWGWGLGKIGARGGEAVAAPAASERGGVAARPRRTSRAARGVAS